MHINTSLAIEPPNVYECIYYIVLIKKPLTVMTATSNRLSVLVGYRFACVSRLQPDGLVLILLGH